VVSTAPRAAWAPLPIARRTLLAGSLGGVALLTTGCGPFGSSAPTTTTVTAPAPEIADPITGLIAVTRLQVLRLVGAAALLTGSGDKAGGILLTGLARDRQAHLDALTAELDRTDPPAGTSRAAPPSAGVLPPAPAPAEVQLPPDSKLVLPAVRSDAAAAQQQFTDALGLVSRYRAALFASIAACLATHRAVLG